MRTFLFILSLIGIFAIPAYAVKTVSSYPDPLSLFAKANQGDAVAQYNLGVLYAQGEAVKQDDKEAAMWFRKAAEQGHATAQYALASILLLGHGIPQDNAEAYFWLILASRSGNKEWTELRDKVASALLPQQVSLIETQAKAWTPSPARPQ